jgi:hypothetical protein
MPTTGLIHGRFTPLADKIALVNSWPGINADEVDAAVTVALNNGTIAGYEAEVGENRLLDIVVTPYRESIPATLLYARERMQEAWGDEYSEWAEAYAQDVDDDRVKAIPGAKPFIPNRIVIEVVDFGANSNRESGFYLEDVQKAEGAVQLADFAIIYNAIQSPEWLRQMDGEKVPYAIVAALLLSVYGYGSWWCSWQSSPGVWHHGGKVELGRGKVGNQFCGYATPVLRNYKR